MICERFASERCNIAINYLSNEDRAKEVAASVEKHSIKATVIQGVGPPLDSILSTEVAAR